MRHSLALHPSNETNSRPPSPLHHLKRASKRGEQLVAHCEIYRTAFVEFSGSYLQVIFESWKPTIDIVDGVQCIEETFHQVVDDGVKSPASLNEPLVHFSIIRRHDAHARLVFAMSHAIYDAISFGKTLDILSTLEMVCAELVT